MQIDIDDGDYARLQSIAKPFEDTPATVVRRLLDAFLSNARSAEDEQAGGEARGIIVYGTSNIPPLTHTKVMAARIGNDAPQKATWDALVKLALIKCYAKFGDLDNVKRSSGANLATGIKTSDGYKPVEGHGFSYQNVSADDAIKIIVRCVRELGLSLEAEFVWRDKEGAHMPGQRARIRFSSPAQ